MFDFVPKVFGIGAKNDSSKKDKIELLSIPETTGFSTEYKYSRHFPNYNGEDNVLGKWSSDKKTMHWYTNAGNAAYQCNELKEVYYWVAFG